MDNSASRSVEVKRDAQGLRDELKTPWIRLFSGGAILLEDAF